MSTTPHPGIHRNIPFADYLRWPLVSQSILKRGRESMSHVKAAMDQEFIKKPTDAMLLGSALHTAFLEPDEFDTRVVEWTGKVRNGKEWDGFQAEHAGKVILTRENYANLRGMVASLRKHPVVRKWSAKIDSVEVSAVGSLEGVPVKGRCDAMTTDPMVDLKSVRSANPVTVTRTILDFGYHIQAHIYRKLFNRTRFMLVCVEAAPPHDVVAYELSDSFLRIGCEEATSLLQRVKFCMDSGAWPGRCDEVVQLEPPEWAATASDITLDGEALEE